MEVRGGEARSGRRRGGPEVIDWFGVQKHRGSKQVKFKQLGPGVKIGVHVVHVQKRVWFEVELHGAQKNHEAEFIQDSNDDAAVAQRKLEVEKHERKTNMNCLVYEQVHFGINVGANIGVSSQNDVEENSTIT
ncbi:hypothetical protein Tco_0633234 [Tanacetum coccineum]